MKTFAVNPSGTPTVYVKTGETIVAFPFKTKRAADRKIVQLIVQGYTFDSMMYALEIETTSNPEYAPTPEHSF